MGLPPPVNERYESQGSSSPKVSGWTFYNAKNTITLTLFHQKRTYVPASMDGLFSTSSTKSLTISFYFRYTRQKLPCLQIVAVEEEQTALSCKSSINIWAKKLKNWIKQNKTLGFASGGWNKNPKPEVVVKKWWFTMIEAVKNHQQKHIQGQQWQWGALWPHFFVGSVLRVFLGKMKHETFGKEKNNI